MTKLGELHVPELFNTYNVELLEQGYIPLSEDGIEEELKMYSVTDEQLIHQEYALPSIMSTWIQDKLTIGSSVAEIGIGSGLLAIEEYGRAGTAPWDGYDISANACTLSESYYQSTTQHDINEAPLPKKYDIILACNVFSDGLLDATCIENIKNSLKEGGRLIASFPRGSNYWVRSGWYYDTYFDLVGSMNMVETGKYYIPNGRRLGQHDLKLLELININ